MRVIIAEANPGGDGGDRQVSPGGLGKIIRVRG